MVVAYDEAPSERRPLWGTGAAVGTSAWLPRLSTSFPGRYSAGRRGSSTQCEAGEVLRFYNEFASECPDELIHRRFVGQSLETVVRGLHFGLLLRTIEEGEQVLRPLRTYVLRWRIAISRWRTGRSRARPTQVPVWSAALEVELPEAPERRAST